MYRNLVKMITPQDLLPALIALVPLLTLGGGIWRYASKHREAHATLEVEVKGLKDDNNEAKAAINKIENEYVHRNELDGLAKRIDAGFIDLRADLREVRGALLGGTK